MSNRASLKLVEDGKIAKGTYKVTTKKQRAGFRRFEAGQLHFGRAQYAQALVEFERALSKDPKNPALMFYVGACYCSMNENAKGLAILRKSLKLDPTISNHWWNYGSYLYFSGEIEEAKKAMRKTIEMMPGKINPLYNYCNIARPTPDDPVVQEIERRIAEGGMSKIDQSFAYYGLVASYEASKEHEKAFDYAIKGGDAYGVECNLDDENVERIVRANTHEALHRQPCGGDPSEAPVFILGMPRSGTTFTETVLSRHPEVFAAGELGGCRTAEILAMNWAGQNARLSNAFEHVRWIVPEVEEVAASYLMSQVDNLAAGQTYTRFVDKLPENVFRLGLISRMFPNARIIVIHRHPLDNCVSCLFQRFNDIQYSYTNRISTLATQYKAYQRVLAHWREVLPLQILELNYQSLVTDFEPQVRRLLEFLDLPWNDACLDPAGATRTVKTASARQVREGVNTKSVDRWRRYGDRVDPLIEALGGMEQVETWARFGLEDHG